MDPIRHGLRLYDPNMIMRSKATYSRADAADSASAQTATAEQSVLAQERAIKARNPGAKTHTTYTYGIGPDGRPYITGASVSVIGTEDELSGSGAPTRPAGVQVSTEAPQESGPQVSAPADGGKKDKLDDPRVKRQIAELQQRQNEVIAHEAAHMAAGGQLAGGASYTYTTGPDGKQYITGGSVPISTPATNDPEEALRNALRVMSAATAPGSPSGPDMAVAANAAQMAAQARIEMAAESSRQSGDAATVGGDDPTGFDMLRGTQASGAYSATKSEKGLWTESGGFDKRQTPASFTSEPIGEKKDDDPLGIAA